MTWKMPRPLNTWVMVCCLLPLVSLVSCGSPTVDSGAPASPSNVTAEAGTGSITVSWSDNSSNESVFVIFRETVGASQLRTLAFEKLTTEAANTTSYQDTGVTAGSSYRYAVAAKNSSGTSAQVQQEGPAVSPNPDGGSTDLESALNTLGVDTSKTTRVDPDQEELPDDYSPLGSSASFGAAEESGSDSGANRTDELLLVGLVDDSGLKLLEMKGVQINSDGSINQGEAVFLGNLSEEENPWVRDDSARYNDVGVTLRDVAAGDVDGDGLEELVAAFVDDSDLGNVVLKIKIIDDQEQDYAEREDIVADADADNDGVSEVFDVAVTTGDFNGDGKAQVVIGLSKRDDSNSNSAELLFLNENAGDYTIDSSLSKTFSPTLAENTITLELATGNLDYDNPEELVVVTNEFMQPSGSDNTGVANFFAYDDGAASFALLDDGSVQGQDGGVHSAVVADVDLGDIDADGLDEIVLGGLTGFNTSCDDSYPYLVVALDDAEHSLAPLTAKVTNASFRNNPCFGPWRIRFVQVNAFDLDGDGIDEVQANQLVFNDLSETGAFTEIHRLPDDVFVEEGSDSSAYLNATTFTIVSGDVTGDGREDLIAYSQFQEDIRIFGKSAIETVGDGGFAELSSISYKKTYNSQETPRPILTPVNIDMDSPVLKYGAGSYQLVFTEPVLIAALAAAPCGENIGQNVSVCATSFGRAESNTVSAEVTVSVKASAYVGVSTAVNVPWVGKVGADFKSTITATASFSAGTAYTVEKSEVFTTGPLEDSVIFTTIPYDVYTYAVLSHPDPEMVGGSVVVALPREPIMVKVERGFYNATVTDTSTRIDSNVFDHTVGDILSYPSASRKNQLLTTYGGLENGPQSVGQGTGSTGLGIDVSTEVSVGGSLGIEYENSVDVTAGPALAGFSVGGGVEASLQVTSGERTTYAVTVGDLDAAHFAANQYSYGMFTYAQELEGQEFEVVNFWVE